MGKNTDPPKCRTCGKSEWRHTCSGLSTRTHTPRQIAKVVNDALAAGAAVTVKVGDDVPFTVGGDSETRPAKITDRKEYLKLKARERRAAEKAGLTVAEYRKQKEGSK